MHKGGERHGGRVKALGGSSLVSKLVANDTRRDAHRILQLFRHLVESWDREEQGTTTTAAVAAAAAAEGEEGEG